MRLDGRPGASGRPVPPDDAPAAGAVPTPGAPGGPAVLGTVPAARPHPRPGRRPAPRRRGALALLPALLLALVVLVAPAAEAHDRLVTSEPYDGQVLHAAPEDVVLTLSSEIVELSGDVDLVLPDGDHVDGLDVVVEGTTLRAALPEGLLPGEYGVVWTVRCSDGHLVEGSFGFAVAAPPRSVPPGTTAVDDAAAFTTPGGDDGAVVSTDVTAVWPVLVGVLAVGVVAGGAYLLVRRYR